MNLGVKISAVFQVSPECGVNGPEADMFTICYLSDIEKARSVLCLHS